MQKIDQQKQNQPQTFNLILSRKHVVDIYLNSKQYSNIISDEDQILLKKYEKQQLGAQFLSTLIFGGALALRYHAVSKKCSKLYGFNIPLIGLSKVPAFFGHAFNLIFLVAANEYYHKYLFRKSVQVISKYDPEAMHMYEFNKVIQ
ncbi:hypothetical protein ABPG74_003941 [Tetrahymena malaccensis]